MLKVDGRFSIFSNEQAYFLKENNYQGMTERTYRKNQEASLFSKRSHDDYESDLILWPTYPEISSLCLTLPAANLSKNLKMKQQSQQCRVQLRMLRAILLMSISNIPSWMKFHLSSHSVESIRTKELTRMIPLQVAHFKPKSYLLICLRLPSSVENFLMEAKQVNSYSQFFSLRIQLTESTMISITLEIWRGRSIAIISFSYRYNEMPLDSSSVDFYKLAFRAARMSESSSFSQMYDSIREQQFLVNFLIHSPTYALKYSYFSISFLNFILKILTSLSTNCTSLSISFAIESEPSLIFKLTLISAKISCSLSSKQTRTALSYSLIFSKTSQLLQLSIKELYVSRNILLVEQLSKQGLYLLCFFIY